MAWKTQISIAKYSTKLRLTDIHDAAEPVSAVTADRQLVALGHSNPDLNANGRDHQELFRVSGSLELYTSPIHGHTHTHTHTPDELSPFFLGFIPDFFSFPFFSFSSFLILLFLHSVVILPHVFSLLSAHVFPRRDFSSSVFFSSAAIPFATLVIFFL